MTTVGVSSQPRRSIALPTDALEAGNNNESLRPKLTLIDDTFGGEARSQGRSDGEEVEERSDDFPDDVPAKGTITVKEIDDNRTPAGNGGRGDTVTSKYKDLVNPDE